MSLGPRKRPKGPRKPVRGLGVLIEPEKRPKPMRQHRADPRPGNRPITAAQWEIIEKAKTSGCIPCLIRYERKAMRRRDVFKYAGWDHCKSGNIRRGHLDGFASCNWHHQGLTIDRPELAHEDFRRIYGPSKQEGGKTFNAYFGSDDDLIADQYKRLHLTPPVNGE